MLGVLHSRAHLNLIMSAPVLRISTYNILAQTLATSRFFPYAGSANLQAKTRVPRLSARLLGLNADVIGITEAFPEALAALASHGYNVSLFASREGRPYGVAIAFRSEVLELLGSASADFDDVADALAGRQGAAPGGGGGGGAAAPELLTAEAFRTNSVALFAALRLRSAPPGEGFFTVASTHLFWNPKFEPVKVAQAIALKRCAAEFSAAHAPPRAPLFAVGDFNSMPGSWVCDVLGARGGVPAVEGGAAAAALVRGWDTWGGAPREGGAAEAWRERLRGALAKEAGLPLPAARPPPGAAAAGGRGTLRSAYALAPGGENEITTNTATFAACIDFVFVEEREVGGAPELLGVDAVPTKAQLQGPIPSAEEPSDHLPLVATFRL